MQPKYGTWIIDYVCAGSEIEAYVIWHDELIKDYPETRNWYDEQIMDLYGENSNELTAWVAYVFLKLRYYPLRLFVSIKRLSRKLKNIF